MLSTLEGFILTSFSMFNQAYLGGLFISRFGVSQSASKACDSTATSGTEVSDRGADSDSEGEEPKDGLDPFSSQGQTETTKSEIYNIV